MNQVDSYMKQPRLYYNIDGLGELGMGVMFLGWALLLWLQAHTPREAIWHQMYGFLVYVGVLLAVIHYGTKAIKTHVTYPRTGFVEYRRRYRWLTAVVTAALTALAIPVLIFATRRHWDVTALPSVFGLVLAAGFTWRIAGAVRWKLAVGVAMVAASLAIALLPPSYLAGLADDSWTIHPVRTKLVGGFLLTLIVYGGLWLISGGISFWLYLRHTQEPAQESQ
jgi:branched-subunit amino acid transport protein